MASERASVFPEVVEHERGRLPRRSIGVTTAKAEIRLSVLRRRSRQQRSVFAVLMWAIWPSRAGALVGLATAEAKYLPRDTHAWAVALPSDPTRRSRFGALGRRNEQTWTLS
jgi:hypothetical protein